MRKAIWIVAALAVAASASWAAAQDKTPEKGGKEDVQKRQEERQEALDAAMAAEDFDKAISVLDEMANDKDVAEDERLAATGAKFAIIVSEKHDGAKAAELARKISEAKKDDPVLLNELAWAMLDAPDLKNRDLDLCMSLAKTAGELSKHEDPAILDTLARVHFEKGDLDKAIEFQTKAMEKSENNQDLPDELKDEVKETLEKYKAKKAEKKPS